MFYFILLLFFFKNAVLINVYLMKQCLEISEEKVARFGSERTFVLNIQKKLVML